MTKEINRTAKAAEKQRHSHPDSATTAPSGKPGQTAFVVQANVNIAGAAEFLVHAEGNEEAEKLAEQILHEAKFKVAALSDSGHNIAVSIPEGCIDCQVVEVEPLQPGFLLDVEGARATVESKMGMLALTEIERLVRSSRFDDELSATT